MCAKSLKDIYRDTRTILKDSGIDNADWVARDLIKRAIDVNDIDILVSPEQQVFEGKVQEIDNYLKRHISGEPVSRIFGEREFWGLPFRITPDVLDPRPDTETIIEAAIRRFFGGPPETVLDFGTGSGCIIISLLSEWPHAKGIGVDVCEKALAVANENGKRHEMSGRLKFVQSNWGESVKGKYDVIVSNPPYISNPEMTNLPPEVKNYDPILALQAGEDGLDCYRIIVTEIKKFLKQGGAAFLEVGHTQAGNVSRLVEDSGLFVNGVHPDMAGIPRVVEISFGEK